MHSLEDLTPLDTHRRSWGSAENSDQCAWCLELWAAFGECSGYKSPSTTKTMAEIQLWRYVLAAFFMMKVEGIEVTQEAI